MLVLASCSGGGEGPAALSPEGAPGAARQAADPTLATLPDRPAEARPRAEGAAEPEGEVAEIPVAASSIDRRRRELSEATAAYRALPPEGRTPALRERYQNDLLQLGRLLASYRPDGGESARTYYRQQAVKAFEELAWDAGEDSAYGVLAYQALADLAREGGAGEDADAFDEAIDRLLDEEDGD